jgi:hypothetical protein
MRGAGRIWTVKTIHSAVLPGFTPPSWTSLQVTRFLIRMGFVYNYFATAEDDKAVFSIPGNTGTYFKEITHTQKTFYVDLIEYIC